MGSIISNSNSKLGRFALFSIGCIIELIVLNLSDLAPIGLLANVLRIFTYPIVMIVVFLMLKKTGIFHPRAASMCFWGYLVSLPGALLVFFMVYVLHYYDEGLTIAGHIDFVLMTLSTILIVIGLLRIAKQTKNNSLLYFASYLLSIALIISQVICFVCKILAIIGEEGILMKINSVYPYFANFIVYGSVIFFLYGLYLNLKGHMPKPQPPFLLRLSSNLIILSSVNLLFYFGSGTSTYLSLARSILIIYVLITIVGGMIVNKPFSNGSRITASLLLGVSFLGTIALKAEPYDIPMLSNLLIVSTILSITMMLFVYFKNS